LHIKLFILKILIEPDHFWLKARNAFFSSAPSDQNFPAPPENSALQDEPKPFN